MTHPIVEREFPADPSGLLLPVTPDNAPYWDALARGELSAQACTACGRVRHPVTPVCAQCGSTHWTWKSLSGRGTVFSWVRYRRGYLPEFADVMPYVVATIELAEGARMFARLLGQKRDPVIGEPVSLVIERWPDGRCVPAFKTEQSST